MAHPAQCFISYSHHDHGSFDRLRAHIQAVANSFALPIWHDRRIRAGSYWNAKIEAEINKSDVFVLLTTNDFFASDYIMKHELPAMIGRHRAHNALITPVIFRESCWRNYFGDYIEVAPKDRSGRWKDGRIAKRVLPWLPMPSPPESRNGLASSQVHRLRLQPLQELHGERCGGHPTTANYLHEGGNGRTGSRLSVNEGGIARQQR